MDSREPTEGERPQSIMEGAGAAVAPRYQALVAIGHAWWEMRERWVIASKDETMSSTGSVAHVVCGMSCSLKAVEAAYRKNPCHTLHWKEIFEIRRFQGSVRVLWGRKDVVTGK